MSGDQGTGLYGWVWESDIAGGTGTGSDVFSNSGEAYGLGTILGYGGGMWDRRYIDAYGVVKRSGGAGISDYATLYYD